MELTKLLAAVAAIFNRKDGKIVWRELIVGVTAEKEQIEVLMQLFPNYSFTVVENGLLVVYDRGVKI